ncbi:NAD(P)-dependent dehydrogenase, short-chain alcohol dehydrogenase family [Actinacidiphila yanglinensis]|uniref:NAD(P)-dependent dehydrogenase, short-chain alcohol dehydrogenase family n=1 Tax=Actinacidiphila yanglinensis TaxID=310779 RepID=A0A1H5VT92_9ACTN|nr:SDR family oxidoreductase [Actinacidiphila yanglinensis]SEF90535.1 NAD(P)-dependent dehydrogenase, short-chain alcohol dehydrogenase family [Actinacidiphila yanglinensis]
MPKTILISGASSGFGAMTARALADAGHVVYAGMRDTQGHNAKAVADARAYSEEHSVHLRTVELDVSDQESVDEGVRRVSSDAGPIDVVVHNAGHMCIGPTEAFTPEQMAQIYDTNVLSTQRLNRAVLPQMRARHDGLLLWVGSSSTYGGTPPFLGPYFGSKAAEDHVAKCYAVELSRFGIDAVIVVPGSYTTGTNHFAHAMQPEDQETARAYDEEYDGLSEEVTKRLAGIAPRDADPAEVARAVVRAVDTPKGDRPFRITVDPADDGSQVVSEVADRIRTEFYDRIDFRDLLTVRT